MFWTFLNLLLLFFKQIKSCIRPFAFKRPRSAQAGPENKCKRTQYSNLFKFFDQIRLYDLFFFFVKDNLFWSKLLFNLKKQIDENITYIKYFSFKFKNLNIFLDLIFDSQINTIRFINHLYKNKNYT